MAKNTNLPKCKSCKERGCNAGLANHDVPITMDTIRGACLLCTCPQFTLEEKDYK